MKKVVLIFIFLFSVFFNYAQSKDQVYAGIIMHIMKYVEWKTYNDDVLKIGIVNDAKLVSSLNKAAIGKNIHFKNVEVKKLDGVTNISGIDVLFIAKKSTNLLSKVSSTATQNNILVITEMKSQSEEGTSINFIEVKGKLQFEIYMSTVDKCGLMISEQLKKYAIIKT